MKIWNSVGVSASGNTFTLGGIELQGNALNQWASHTITTDNLANGKPIYYYRDCTGVDVDGIPVGQVIFANCAGVRAANLNASDTGMGIEVGYSRDVVLAGNDLSRNDYGLYADTVTNLTVAGNRMASNDPHGAWLWNVQGANVTGNAIEANALWGLYVGSSQGVVIAENTVSANNEGMYLIGDDALTVRDNTVASNTATGIEATSSSNLRVERNRIVGNGDGILIGGSTLGAALLDENWIEANTGAGVRASGGNGTMDVTATRNTFRGNGYGMALASVSALVHHNNFETNAVQAVDNPGASVWDGGYPSGGNFWSDYAGVDQCSGPLQNVCPDPDAIGDTPYVLDADSRDRYPLMTRVPTVWSNTPPSVARIVPAGQEDWTGGSVHDVRWNATDAQDAAGNLTVNVSYSADGGATWTVVASGLAGNGVPYPWRVPTITASGARVRVCVRDSQNATACAAGGTFAIDSTPPAVIRSSTPTDAAPRDAPLQIVFSEPMDRASVLAAFSLAPDPGGVSFRWSTESGGDVLLVDHAPLAADTPYTLEVGLAARDRSDPGNHLATPWTLTFRTSPAPGVGPTAPVSAGLGAFLALFALLVVVASALAVGTERGRVSLLTPIVLAVSRRRHEGEEEESETRGMIRGYLLVHPGDTYTDIKRNLRLANGTATWHLRKLELAGVIRSRADGTRRRYYPSDVPLPRENGGELPEIQQRLVQRVTKDPGQPIRLIAEELGISSQLALYHLRNLREKGLLRLERRGWWLSAYPSEGLPPR